jgi:hypothetical protein
MEEEPGKNSSYKDAKVGKYTRRHEQRSLQRDLRCLEHVLRLDLLPLVKNEKHAQHQAAKSGGVIPFLFLAEIGHGERRENYEGDQLLNRFSCAAENSYDPIRFAGT